jgi:hypothetical protein
MIESYSEQLREVSSDLEDLNDFRGLKDWAEIRLIKSEKFGKLKYEGFRVNNLEDEMKLIESENARLKKNDEWERSVRLFFLRQLRQVKLLN